MRVTAVLGAQAVQFLISHEPPEEERVPLYPIIRSIQERYFFLQIPSKIEDYDWSKGVTFLGGVFEKKIIDKFQVYTNGILCESKTDTAHCDQFIDDVLTFADELKVPFSRKSEADRAYFSSLEVHMEGGLSEKTIAFSALSSLIMDKFKSYGLTTKAFPLFGFKMNADALNETVPIPSEFVFERRAAQPFASSLYASWGPFKTNDHLELLKAIEVMMLA